MCAHIVVLTNNSISILFLPLFFISLTCCALPFSDWYLPAPLHSALPCFTRHNNNNTELLTSCLFVSSLSFLHHLSMHPVPLRSISICFVLGCKKGDALITTCYYDTRGYTNTTLGGFSISDEMCVNYIQYYPATQLEVCKSSVSEKTLEDYFFYMKRYLCHLQLLCTCFNSLCHLQVYILFLWILNSVFFQTPNERQVYRTPWKRMCKTKGN